MPLVSIIIPAYNTASYIHRAIESSLRQTHSNIEAIVIDDGSTDDTLRVALSYAERDSRVRVYHQTNAGVSVARNHGMREAHGEYLMFLDSDDWLEENAVEFLLSEQLWHPDMMIAADVFKAYFDAKNNGILRRKPYREVLPTRLFDVEGTLYASIKFMMLNFYPKIFRRDVIDENNISFHEGIHYGEDQLFVFSYLVCMNGTAFFSRPLLNYLKRPGSAMSTPLPQRKSNRENLYTLMINNPKNTPAIREALKKYHASRSLSLISRAIKLGESDKYIRDVLRRERPFTHCFLTLDTVSVKEKISYIIKMFFPVPIVKYTFRTWERIKSFMKISHDDIDVNDSDEIVADWLQ
ncbi:MAG: glycosyltransferase family 2 protein [Synergistaceae bacterium]|nr:glycosyltransferase family 2 protein [Synergistaceae bacterium]MBR0150371.1 glycosyltransferase family 2 protein [Synergistaceae bacterium]MBR0257404.1 glycosyltransferase family 2 protein [Synergistaceae bacterium]